MRKERARLQREDRGVRQVVGRIREQESGAVISHEEVQRLLEREAAQLVEADDRPPICPACGVTMGIVAGDDETPLYVCLECGFSDELGTENLT